MNDNRLYIMKDFTYAILCKHLHKIQLQIASRNTSSGISNCSIRVIPS